MLVAAAAVASLPAAAEARPPWTECETGPVPAPSDDPPPVLGAPRFDPSLDRYVASYGAGSAVLTLDHELQEKLQALLEEYRVVAGATVLIEATTGRVLAIAEHSEDGEESARGLAFKAIGPAASIFKMVTGAALLARGVDPEELVCYHGGRHRISPKQLAEDPLRDGRCVTLSDALGLSANVVFAKLAARCLDRDALAAQAERLYFNTPIPFAMPVEVSKADFPEDPFALATTAAGFGPTRLSPFHGAVLASIVANRGRFVPPVIVADALGAEPPPEVPVRQVMSATVADTLARMMRSTVTSGTARRYFRPWRGPFRELSVAGKTGSLFEHDPFKDFTWFVGFAPVDRPQIIVASVVVNGRLWRVKAPYVAAEALRAWYAKAPAG